jgi:hypothetical protein
VAEHMRMRLQQRGGDAIEHHRCWGAEFQA